MDIETLIKKRDVLRYEWREIRKSRLLLKKEFVCSDCRLKMLKSDRRYIDLKKRQIHLSKMIKHVEKNINRRLNGQGD